MTPNAAGDNANLYNKTYYKSVNDTSSLNTDTARNKITTAHVNGTTYTDVNESPMLDFGEPSGQTAYDNTTNVKDTYLYDEKGLFS